MIIIGTDGQYETIPGTQTLKTSDHPVYQAQIELNLNIGGWIGAPGSGHSIVSREKQSVDQINESNKELKFYLKKYNPDVRASAISRTAVATPVVIAEDALDV